MAGKSTEICVVCRREIPAGECIVLVPQKHGTYRGRHEGCPDRVFLFGQRTGEGKMIPRGHGIAWRTWERPGCVTFPVPLNWIALGIRSAWLALAFPKTLRDDAMGAGEHAGAFRRGVEAGRGLSSRGR